MRVGTVLLLAATLMSLGLSQPASAGWDDTHPHFYGRVYLRPYGIARHGYRPVLVEYHGGKPAITYWGRPGWHYRARRAVRAHKVKWRYRSCRCGAYYGPPYRRGPVWPRSYYNVRVYYGWQ